MKLRGTMSLNDHTVSLTSASRPAAISENATGMIVASEPKLYDYNKGSNSSTTLTNWDVHIYAEILQTIHLMAEMSEGEQLFLEPGVARRAREMLSFLKDHLSIDPPKIINQDGQALSLTWTRGNGKHYLTIADDEVDLMYLSPDHPNPHVEILANGNQIPYEKIFESRLALPKSHSTV